MTKEFRAGGRTEPQWRVRRDLVVRAVATRSGAKAICTPVAMVLWCPCGFRFEFDPDYSAWVACQHCGRPHFVDAGNVVQ